MAKTNQQVIEAWLRGDGKAVQGGNLRCDRAGRLYSYNLLIGAFEHDDTNTKRGPVLWKYQSSSIKAENASVSVTTTSHVSKVRSVARKMNIKLEERTPTAEQVRMAKARRGPVQSREGGW